MNKIRQSNPLRAVFTSLLFTIAMLAATFAQAQTPLLQLKASNYNPTTGLWTATVGANAQAGGTYPTLATGVSPNGAPAVVFSGANYLTLASSIAAANGYTAFAYIKPATGAGPYALFGGAAGAFEYRIYNSKQDVLRQQQADLGSETTALSTSAFSIIAVTVTNSGGGGFRLNGTADGNNSASSFTQPIAAIGARASGTGQENFSGSICEIDIYSGVLSTAQITNIEAQLTANYITVNALVLNPATVSPTNNVYAGTAVTLAAAVIGGTGTTTYQWQTDNGSGGASYSNIGGATSTNYVLNTTSLSPNNYEYQLVGTPFGGSSVTSAPVTLTVNAASAPVVLSDTTFSPATATVGGNDTVTASFTGTLPIGGYQWYTATDGSGTGATPITGQTNTTLVLTNLQLVNSGIYYSLRATNAVSPYVGQSSWQPLTVNPLTALVQLMATNYDPIAGVWHDTSGNGNDATYFGASTPTLVPFVTPNGGSAVNLTGAGSLLLASSLDPSSGYTVFAYVKPSTVAGRNALTGGSSGGALEYDFNGGNQDYLREYQADVGHGAVTIPTSSFSMVDLAVNSSGATFRLNGTNDATVSGATFTSPITRIGNNEGSGDGYVGDIAEIDIYSGVLSSLQIGSIEAQLTAKYGVVGVATNPTNITATVVGSNLQLSWPTDHTGWTLQAQTNSLSTGLGTNWVNVPSSTTTNSVTVPIVTGNGSVFYRLKF